MKKSLLGLAVAALTLFGCQNYDDQFDDLNNKIANLASQVGELSGLAAAVQAVGDRVSALETATAQELAEILGEVSGLQAQLASIETVTAEVDDLNNEVDMILGKLNELLEQAAVINQDVVITSVAQLEYVESLMALDPSEDNTFVGGDGSDATRQYILSGNLTVDAEFTSTSTATAADLQTRLDNVLDRIATVIAPDGGTGVRLDSGSSATAGVALDVESLSFVQGPVVLEGANAIAVDNLAALTSTLTVGQGGDVAFPGLNQVGDVVLAATSTITSIDFSSVATGGTITTDTDELVSAALAGPVNLGKLDLPATVDLAKATSIMAGGAPNGVSISAPKASPVQLMDTTPFASTGTISITAEGDIHVNVTGAATITITSTKGAIQLNSLTGTSSAVTLTASETIHATSLKSNAGGLVASGSEVHLGALESNAGGATITAGIVDLTKFKSNTNTITIATAKVISLPALTDVASAVIATSATTFDAPVCVTGSVTGTLKIGSGATLHLGSLTATNVLAAGVWGNVKVLQLNQQASDIDFSGAASLTTLRYTGKKITPVAQGSQSNTVTITGANANLKNVSFPSYDGKDNHLGTLTVTGTTIGKLETGGVIINTNVVNNGAMTDIIIGHAHLNGELATTITVSGNSSLTTLDLSSMNKVKAITVTGNSKITAITAPALTKLAEPVADIDVIVTGNALEGAYTSAVSGTETSPYAKNKIHYQESVASLIGFIAKYQAQERTAGVSTITYNIDIDKTTTYVQTYDAGTETWSEAASTATKTTLSSLLDADNAAKKGSDNDASTTADNHSDNAANAGSGISSAAELSNTVTTTS